MNRLKIAIVGATGLVGRTLLKVLEETDFEIDELHLIASFNSVGKSLKFRSLDYPVEMLEPNIFKSVDFTFFCSSKEISKAYARLASKSSIVIDNSNAFRMEPDVPLVVPEVNAPDIRNRTLIANPNCSTIPSVMVLKALMKSYTIKSVNFATYQATSGSGQKGVVDLEETRKGNEPKFYPYPIALTCIPEIGEPLDNGYTTEEEKMVKETRKILHLPHLPISATCIRVPVLIGHGVVMRIELNEEINLNEIKELLKGFPGIQLVDQLKDHIYPTSMLAMNNDTVYVGRLRKDESTENGILLYHVSDNLQRGAASNALKIMECLLKN